MDKMELINFLNKNPNTRKIFGKKELEIMKKQFFGSDLTQSEKNRLSRDIRKKFEFIKEINVFQDDFKLEKNQNNKKIIEKTLRVILSDKLKKDIDAVLLFGSFADNSFTKRSDIDICVVFNKNISLKESILFRIRVSGEINEKVDIQVFNVLPQKIKKEVAKNHKVLYKNINYDNLGFSIQYLKDSDYFSRMERIFS